MSVLNRAMFRIPGQDQLSGIMRSSPELIRVSTANASPLNKSFVIPPPAVKVPSLNMNMVPGVSSAATSSDGKFIFPRVAEISTEDIDPEAEKTKLEQLKEIAATEKKLTTDTAKKESDKTVDNLGNKINKSNQDIFDKEAENFGGGDISLKEAPLTSNVVKDDTGTTTTRKEFDFSDTKEGMQKISTEIQNLYTNFSKDMSNLGNRDLFGTTMNESVEAYREALGKRPKEIGFDDVKDDVFELLGYNRDTLDENLSKDQQSAIWLNVMRAGLAVAAGESDNALTNVAKGFGVGLEGYGRDIKDINEDYREDVKTYTTTAYTMLKDAKAEELAKNTLNLQRAGAEFQITSKFFGIERENLLNQLNREVAGKMLKMNHLKAFSEMDFEKYKFDVSKEQADKANELAFNKLKMMTPELITGAILDGYVELKDPTKPATPDNLKPTKKFAESGKSLTTILANKNIRSLTNEQTTRNILGKIGGYGITYTGNKELPQDAQNAIGQKISELEKSGSNYKKAMDAQYPNYNAALSEIIGAYRPLQKFEGVKLSFESLNENIKTAIRNALNNDTGDEIGTTFNNNRDLFIDFTLNP
jgi:hypothetical protein